MYMATLSAEENLQIIKHLADKCAAVPECGFVLPAPIFFNDKEDFHAQIRSIALNTRKAIETAEIAFCSISFLRFEDEDTEASDTNFSYEFYVFRQYGLERSDESVTPDAFLKRMLKSYQNFLAAILGLRAEFAGENPIPDLDEERFAEALTKSLVQDEFVSEGNTVCKYIPGVRGFAAELTGTIEITMREC